MNIALDVSGGDLAPQATVEGAILALDQTSPAESGDLVITLIGDKSLIDETYQKELPAGINVLNIPLKSDRLQRDPFTDGDDPSSAIRTALRLHSKGKFDAVVSAGPTGAQVIASLTELGKIRGITRPAVGSFLPTVTGQCYLLDVGASLTASPHHLVQFATMGHVYVHELLGIEEPRIGVLNVGRESSIGERSVTEAHALLADSGFNFTGFVEGRSLPAGVADVVVTNGFIGNVLLKFFEGIPILLKKIAPAEDSTEYLKSIEDKLDYQAFGGEPLLGVKGISIICHGSSTSRSIALSIMQAARMARIEIHRKLENFLVSKFDSYFSQVKYLRSFRRSFNLPGRFRLRDVKQTRESDENNTPKK